VSDYDLLRSVAGNPEPDRRLRMEWMALPGRPLPEPPPPAGDPFGDDEHLGFGPAG
jgi:hypothetical protein